MNAEDKTRAGRDDEKREKRYRAGISPTTQAASEQVDDLNRVRREGSQPPPRPADQDVGPEPPGAA
jgi:hypothetical protein